MSLCSFLICALDVISTWIPRRLRVCCRTCSLEKEKRTTCRFPEHRPSEVATHDPYEVLDYSPAAKNKLVLHRLSPHIHDISWKPTKSRGIRSNGYRTTTIFPLASFDSMTLCASRMSSKRNTRVGFAL